MSFADLGIGPSLAAALEKNAIVRPTAVQAEAIPAALAGESLIAVAQTGSGKTLAYALPILTLLEKNPKLRAFVMTPTRETAQQVHKVFVDLDPGLTNSLVVGGIPNAEQVRQLKKIPRLIVATPGRMYDHLINNKLLLQNVGVVAIDEADRMLDMGFAPQLKNIHATMRGTWQTLMFAASFGGGGDSVAKIFMQSEPRMIRTADSEAPVATLKQKIYFLKSSEKNARLETELRETEGAVIVFTDSQESCVAVGRHLKENGFSTELIHGGLTAGHRNRVVREFRAGEIRVLVTTDLLARGLDFPQVTHVISYELPYKAEDFLHRIGRTARAGRAGRAITFVTGADGRTFKKIRGYLKDAEEIKPDPNFKFTER